MDRLARLLSPRSIAIVTAAVLLGLACLALRSGHRHVGDQAGADRPEHPAVAQAAGACQAAVAAQTPVPAEPDAPGETGGSIEKTSRESTGGQSRSSSGGNGTVPPPGTPVASTGDAPAPAGQGVVPLGGGRCGPAALRGSPAPVEPGARGAGPLLVSPLPPTADRAVERYEQPEPVGPAESAGAAQAAAVRPDRPGPLSPAGLPPAPPTARSEALENIARQADQQIYHGFDLANRQAYFAARSEFVAALRLVAQGLDAQEHSSVHSQSLAAGLTALKEAQDFMPADARTRGRARSAGHRGRASHAGVKGCSTRPTPGAGGGDGRIRPSPSSSWPRRRAARWPARWPLWPWKTARGLGRPERPGLQAPEPKAVAFFQAALLVYPQNYIAANELGVLLARNGDYAHARRMLEHSVSVGRTALGLRNLASVYRRLGQPQLAELAGRQAAGLAAAEAAHRDYRGSPTAAVRWVEPEVLARTARQAATR